MAYLDTIERVCWAGYGIAELYLMVHIVRVKLLTRYPIFATFLLVDLCGSVLLANVSQDSGIYQQYYRSWGVLSIVLYIAIAYELYLKVCAESAYPKMGRFKWNFGIIVVVVSLGLGSTVYFQKQCFESVHLTGLLTSSLAIWIAITCGGLSRITGGLCVHPANVIRHSRLLTGYFVFNVFDCVFSTLTPYPAVVDIIYLLGQTACLVLWSRFDLGGEVGPPLDYDPDGPTQEELLRALDF